MAKTKEELDALREEFETMNKKLTELTEEELAKVSGGELPRIVPDERFVMFSHAIDWESDNKLPTEPGSYKVSNDIPSRTSIEKYKDEIIKIYNINKNKKKPNI